MKLVAVLFLLMANTICLAQYNPLGAITMWTDGYVVTTKNDTIRGELRIGSLVNSSPANVIFRNADKSKTKVKAEELRLIAQRIPNFAYKTGSIPTEQELVVFERVPNPRQKGKLMLLERLTPFGGSVALYFDASGWKKTTEFTFGNFILETDRLELSYIVLKNGRESFLAKRANFEAVHDRLFGDCPAFVRNFPTANRRDWRILGEMVTAYNQLCQKEPLANESY
ncbi:hypothetical protein [Spirosoma terrae]|uniref:DUF4468 domain-containing protein n=1 Tax=Spirosoma terrae TaxID=1968276 RepID=A0A6L9LCF7_9BACT|nr:hypothetical protein [Spirosoma terrae]NDU98196.1 hypothetical protein [Spirosoma terrae]